MQEYIMRKAVYPGTFDPVTYGHLDVIKRGSKIFDELIVAVGHNPLKEPLFTISERMDMISKNTGKIPNIKVDRFEGMLIDYMREMQTNVILRGIRTVSDFEYEFQRALTNRVLKTDIETVFIMTSQEYSFLNSSLIKEAVSLGGNISMFVPSEVEKLLQKKFTPLQERNGR
ncbi:MAG: phosphopantetheine adenylyltransferase [Candidatus Scalindua rubra]|uniref:Phosphopantetheine adenylyltransferase n=1 Tax=Candidatus Scalindua rubra TaxID=1872076 RepID=A0A1E3X8S6_9BACT|nr:MAG: phosphopantetheine adenylyltransferase [Candidatus Scalindua rubra]